MIICGALLLHKAIIFWAMRGGQAPYNINMFMHGLIRFYAFFTISQCIIIWFVWQDSQNNILLCFGWDNCSYLAYLPNRYAYGKMQISCTKSNNSVMLVWFMAIEPCKWLLQAIYSVWALSHLQFPWGPAMFALLVVTIRMEHLSKYWIALHFFFSTLSGVFALYCIQIHSVLTKY